MSMEQTFKDMQETIDRLESEVAACKRALAWAWNNDDRVDLLDWDAFFGYKND